jgi:hypothetical protein
MKSMRSRVLKPVRVSHTMRGPRRKPAAGNGLSTARLLAIFSALGAGGVTYISVQSLGQLVLQQHQGAVGTGSGAAVSGGGNWRNTWKLASELGAGEHSHQNTVLPLSGTEHRIARARAAHKCRSCTLSLRRSCIDEAQSGSTAAAHHLHERQGRHRAAPW